jgi:hypothetical protein
MDSLRLFSERLPALESLPEIPSILWYPSAGVDFRSPVFLTKHHIDFEKKHHGRNFKNPDLFILNCMGPEVVELRAKLELGGELVLLNDHSTKILARNYQSLKIREDINFQINPDFIDTEALNLYDYHTNFAFYFELEVSGENYSETQKILYFECENIDFFNQIILSNIFETTYLCATREGIAWGRCRKSVIDYIYLENQPSFLINRGFKPEFNILFTDFTRVIFEEAANNSDLLSIKTNYGRYISKSDGFSNDSVIYKIAY